MSTHILFVYSINLRKKKDLTLCFSPHSVGVLKSCQRILVRCIVGMESFGRPLLDPEGRSGRKVWEECSLWGKNNTKSQIEKKCVKILEGVLPSGQIRNKYKTWSFSNMLRNVWTTGWRCKSRNLSDNFNEWSTINLSRKNICSFQVLKCSLYLFVSAFHLW